MSRLLLALLLSLSLPLAAQEKPADLDQLLQQLLQQKQQQQAENRQREARFVADKSEQQQKLKRAQAELKKAQEYSALLKQRFDANEAKLTELEQQLQQRLGNLGELFAVAKQGAGDLNSQLQSSLISSHHRDRAAPLAAMAAQKSLPTVEQLEQLWFTLQQEMTESGKIERYSAEIVAADGTPRPAQVTRIGPFTATAEGRYLRYLPESQQLVLPSRQPGSRELALAEQLEAPPSSELLTVVIDPTQGSLLGLLVQSPTLLERIEQGGAVGYTILLLALFGLLIALWRYLVLSLTALKVRRQLNNPQQPSSNNPLGRVLAAFEQRRRVEPEQLALYLDEAILAETPRLERGTRIIKLLAGIAPLLGLLGTVIGMIATFQAITLFGSGDPKLMAGGISQALVTTVLGLLAAIPLLFSHALVSSRSRELIQILDQQSAGLLAQRLEDDA